MISRMVAGVALLSALLFSVFVSAQPVVVVLDYGAAPHEELIYKFTDGQAVNGAMSMEMQMTMSMGSQQMQAMSIPPIRIPISIRTTELLEDGSARYEFEMGEPTIGEEGNGNPVLAQLGASLGQIGNLSGWGWIDARGNALDGGFSQPTGALSAASQVLGSIQGQLQQLSAPFPAEAVGVGARWQVTGSTQMAGAAIMQTLEYTLLAREGDRVELGIDVVQAGVQTPPAGLPDAQQAALGSMDGGGRMTVDLNAPLVPLAEMNMSTSTSTPMPGQDGTQSMTMNMQMKMSITPDD